MNKKKILITGGAGFIGSNLALKLVKNGACVTILDNLSEQIHGKDANSTMIERLKEETDFILGDVRSQSDWLKAIKGQDIVVHLAAETGTGQSMYEIEKYTDVNINGTAKLLDILVNTKHQVKKVVIASSRAIYGEGRYLCELHGMVYPEHRINDDLQKGIFEVRCPQCRGPVQLQATDEESKIHPSSIYGITKQNQEQMVLTMGKSIGIPAVAFRYQNVYGPGQSLNNPYTGILSIFSTRIKNNKPINIFEDGLESRDFVYIDDVVDATILGIEKDEADYQAFNVGSGEATDVITIVQKLKEQLGSEVEAKISGDYRLGDIRHNIADLTKVQSRLGFRPTISIEEGLSRFIDWVKKEQVQVDRYEDSLEELRAKGLFK